MKILLEIVEAIFSLFRGVTKKKVLTTNLDYQKLGVDINGHEMGTTADLSEEDLEHARHQFQIDFQPEKNIICNNHEVSIDWEDTLLWTEPGALMCKSNQYKTISGNRGQSIDKIVVHWDGCLNSAQCAKVLGQRGLSAHFCIDNDGTIHQLMDTNHVGWHARGVNSKSIGIEISNAVFMKYAEKYDPPRPVTPASTLHGKPFPEHLGFYDVQVDALKALLKTLCGFYNVPLECPNQNGELIKGVIKASSFKGIICHYHVTENKSDPACLDLAKVIEEIKDETD
tara:strand:+ start:11678 stop:12529 length:852 start_codon:yes stop_codon:yes gene_type:complete